MRRRLFPRALIAAGAALALLAMAVARHGGFAGRNTELGAVRGP